MIQKYINSVKHLASPKVDHSIYDKLLAKVQKTNQQLFAMLRAQISDDAFNDERTYGITIPDSGITLIQRLIETISRIEASRKQNRGAYEMDGRRIVKLLEQFTRQNDANIWLELEDGSALTLCCCPKNMADTMEKMVWNRNASYVLTSGTMSDGMDFSFFKKENGISPTPEAYGFGELHSFSL